MWKILLPIAGIVILAAVVLTLVKSQVGPQQEHTTGATVGATLPDFTLTKFPEGKAMKASEIVAATKSKVLLINFWATWCEACMVEMPSIVKLYESYKAKGFEVLAVNLDENPQAVVPKATKQLSMSFGVYTDPDSEVAALFDVHAIPLTAIIDANRKVLLIEDGERDWNDQKFRSKIEAWLK